MIVGIEISQCNTVEALQQRRAYDPVVLKTIEKMQNISLSEPTAVTAPDGMMTEVEKIKYSNA